MLCGPLAALSPGLIALIAICGFAFLVLVWFVAVRNGFVTRRMQVKNGWAQIDVQLKRRHDLIPNLVESVKGYMGFEKEVLENITRARSEAMKVSGQGAAAQVGPEAALTAALGRFYAVMENYPDLKSNVNVGQLMEELTATENRIAFARQHYNDEVMRYNTSIQLFPASIVANICGFTAEAFFEIQAPEREVPKVSLR